MHASRSGRGAVSDAALSAGHARFARAAMLVYLATAAVGLGSLVVALESDRAHQQEEATQRLVLQTHLQAESFGRHLHLLVEELTRLGLRTEIDLLDRNMEPERSLLRLSHENSTFFNVGVAILDRDGRVVWSEPRSFLAEGYAEGAALVADLSRSRAARVMPGARTPQAAVVYVASPIMRYGRLAGALLGAVDLVSEPALVGDPADQAGRAVALVTRNGQLVYAVGASDLENDPSLKTLFPLSEAPLLAERVRGGRQAVVAGAPVQGTELALLSLADTDSLFGPARQRLTTRLASALVLASVPLVLLVVLLRRSLRAFRKSEEDVLRNERLRSLGEAADLIAHEVKNSLNGLRVGLDLVLHGDRDLEARKRQAVMGLRTEMERLSGFTTELLSFSKGVVPRPVPLELGELVRRVAELGRDTAKSRRILFSVFPPPQPVRVRADPSLIHVVITNLVSNALDFAGDASAPPAQVTVRVGSKDGVAEVRVADNGPGVAESVRRRLFDPFVTAKPNGVGIGLALSRRIARAHGGDLTLEDSQPGAAFRLTLPLEAA